MGAPRRAEKNLEALRDVLESLADTPACLCFVGDGPARRDLERHFEGLPVYFTVRPCGAVISHKALHHGLAHVSFQCLS